MELASASALVTGASRGIGRAVALALARAGARVTLVARSRKDLDAVATEIAAAGGSAIVHAADLRDAGAPRAARSTPRSSAYGGLQILVNNAGVGGFSPLAETSDEDWDRILGTNLTAVFRLTRAALPQLTRRGGHIFMISSLAGQNPIANMSAYCASKAALDHLARCLMLEVRHQGVKVTTIAPGSVDTGFAGMPRAGDASWMLSADDVAGTDPGPAPNPRRRPSLARRDAPGSAPEEGVIRAAVRLAWRALVRFFDHNGPDRAAAVAYYTLLSLLPLLIFVINVGVTRAGLVRRGLPGHAVPAPRRGHPARPAEPAGAARVRRAGPRPAPGPSILLLAWTSKRIFASLFSALERVFEVEARAGRGFARGNLRALRDGADHRHRAARDPRARPGHGDTRGLSAARRDHGRARSTRCASSRSPRSCRCSSP